MSSELHETIRQVLAAPREAGTPAAAAARELVAAHLTALGYRVTVQRFRFAPASLHAFPLFGAGLGWLALLLIPFLLANSFPVWSALAFWAGGLAALVLIAVGIGMGRIPLGTAPREDANLVAIRGEGGVRRWIVAHLDSKAQTQSMAGRLVAVWAAAAAVVTVTALAGARVGGPMPLWAIAAGTAAAIAAGVLAARARLRGTSRGGRDNGSGLLAALAAAEAARESEVGILITGAEEFGLVGARIFARLDRALLRGTEVVNLDTIDDQGPLYLVSHDRKGSRLARTEASRLGKLGLELRLRRLPLGILVDSVPLARAGAAAITLGRVTWETLRLIHTPADTPEGLSMETAERIGRAVAAI